MASRKDIFFFCSDRMESILEVRFPAPRKKWENICVVLTLCTCYSNVCQEAKSVFED